jgi:hypothetical protein
VDLLTAWLVAGFLLVVVLYWLLADRLDATAGRRRAHERGGRTVAVAAPLRRLDAAYTRRSSSLVVFGPPTVPTGGGSGPRGLPDRVPLRDWLLQMHPDGPHVWAEVVTEVCAMAARDAAIAAHFARSGPAALQRHFLAVVMLLTGTEITTSLLGRLRLAHASSARGGGGAAVTHSVYDAFARGLVEVLHWRGVPEETLRELAVALLLLRDVIVVDDLVAA